MPDSKLPFPGQPSNEEQDSGFQMDSQPSAHIAEDQVSGGVRSDIDSAGKENCEPGETNSSPPEHAAEIGENIIETDDRVEGHEDDENIDIAIALMKECKAQLSLPTLNNVVFLFRQVLDCHPPTHPLHPDSTRDLASALGFRFMYTNQIEDLKESLFLRAQIMESLAKGNVSTTGLSSTSLDLASNNVDTQRLTQMAKNSLSELQRSIDLDIFNTIIEQLQRSLVHIHNPHPKWFAALMALVDGLYARFYYSNRIADLNDTISCLEDTVSCCVERDWQQLYTLLQLYCMLAARFDLMGEIPDLKRALTGFIKATGGPLALLELANTLVGQFRESGNMDDIHTAVALVREGLTELPLGSQNYITALNNLATVLGIRFEQRGQRDDLHEAISIHRQALELRPSPHPDRSTSLDNLASVLSTRFKQEGQRNDLDESISLHKQALELRPSPDPYRFNSLNNLAIALLTQFEKGGQRGDLDEAISLSRQALELQPSPHPDRSTFLNNLAYGVWTRFQQGGQKSDLDESISLHRQALDLRPSPHPHRSGSLNNLASALVIRFEQGGQKDDLHEAISLHRQALELRPLPHPERSISLINLASALWTQFEKGGHRNDLDEAISLHRQALKLRPSPHPERSTSLNNLASALSTRFKQEGQTSDLDESISLHRQALELRPSPHPGRSISLNNVAFVLSIRFEQGGQRSDLDEAISFNRQALELQLLPHPDRSASLNNLASAVWTRFRQGGQKNDLDESIFLYRQALELRPLPHPDRSSTLNNLASAVWARGQRGDLDEAIFLYRQALELSSLSHPDRSALLNNLASAVWTRFLQGGQKGDLDEAISLHRQALELLPSPHPDRSGSLNNLASALSTQFQQEGQRNDLDEAISLHKQALELQPSPHPGRSTSLSALGNVFVQAHFLNDRNSDFLDQAMSSFSAATQCLSQSPSKRLHIAKQWIHHADNHNHISAIDAYDAALQALPQLAALSFDIQSRQEALSAGSDGLARDASRCAIKNGDFIRAIEFLEAGRSIFWSQSLSLRSPFDQLHDINPQLADKLQDIATALELGSHRNILADISDNQKKLSIDQEASKLNRFNEEWINAIAEVRKLPGFEDFLQPRRLSMLQTAASEYPVVILVANYDGSHCLIMTSTTVHHIDIPNLQTHKLQKLVQLVQAAISHMTVSCSSLEMIKDNVTPLLGELRGMRLEGDKLASSDDVFKFVLRVLWDEVVKPVINFLKIKKSHTGEQPVLQWCLTGAFTFLPIHAAGCYDIELSKECASDYFISSYTPTIGALLTHDSAPSTENFKMTVVIQSKELPSTKKELQNIEQHVSSGMLTKLGVSGVSATIEAVACCLSNASIVHFACHGTQDQFKPLDSGLKLDDGILRVSRIMKEKMPNGSLAFLCACETGKGDENLPDEAMSLGASLLFSGFRRVIATMWEIIDTDGPTIADAFYEELFRGPDGKPALEPDVKKSAHALDIAVKKLRSKNVSFCRWVPFIHMGK